MRSLPTRIAAALTVAMSLACGAPPVVEATDPRAIDMWCGDSLCDWRVERGHVARGWTWHPDDVGVELGDKSAIEQTLPISGYAAPYCIRFDLLAHVASAAGVQLKVDVFADGTVEHAFDLPADAWTPTTFLFAIKAPFTGVRIEIVKNGFAGPAIVARLLAQVVEGELCAGLVPLDGGRSPLGAACMQSADCADGLCPGDLPGKATCSECNPQDPKCPEGTICGLGEPFSPYRSIPYSCVAPGIRALAENCASDAECASGICLYGACSACRSPADCGGSYCSGTYTRGPYICNRNFSAPPGAPCVVWRDCASGRCGGDLRRQCSDGRACAFDSDCPDDVPRHADECRMVGIEGGVCD